MKIITDIKQLEAINNAVKERENNPDSQYCELNKHASLEKYVIPIMDKYLKNLGLDFINDEWLNTDIVEELPQDWTWHFDTANRVIIPNNLILKNEDLKTYMIESDLDNVKKYVDKDVTYYYPESIKLKDSMIFTSYESSSLSAKEDVSKLVDEAKVIIETK